jgi:hypothetical protein
MKTLFVSLAALIFTFIFGCQSSITDPEVLEPTKFIGSSDQENSIYKDVFSATYPNVIKLKGLLWDPSHRLNSFAEIDGVVRYGIKKVSSGSNSQTPIDIYRLDQMEHQIRNSKLIFTWMLLLNLNVHIIMVPGQLKKLPIRS